MELEGEYAVLGWVLPLPIDVMTTLMRALAAGLEDSGLEAFYKVETGLGRLWVRRIQ